MSFGLFEPDDATESRGGFRYSSEYELSPLAMAFDKPRRYSLESRSSTESEPA